MKFSPRTNITNTNQQTLFVKMDQIQTVVNDVSSLTFIETTFH